MNPDQLALLRNIRANPDDDLSRLVYADWVEERGDQPMANLIRCHIERERAEPNSERYFELISHTGMLLAQHRDRWTAELRERFGVTGVEFVRGIPEEVEMPLDCFAAVAVELFATLPVRHVMLSGVGTLAEVRSLNLPPDVVRSVSVQGEERVSLGFRERWMFLPVSRTFTLLDQAPKALEPFLRTGRWLVLSPAMWSGPDRETEQAWFNHFREQPNFTTRDGGLRLATRPFDEPDEFAAWCSVPNPMHGPHWIELEDGRLVSHRRGYELPEVDEEQEEADVYDEDWE